MPSDTEGNFGTGPAVIVVVAAAPSSSSFLDGQVPENGDRKRLEGSLLDGGHEHRGQGQSERKRNCLAARKRLALEPMNDLYNAGSTRRAKMRPL